MKFIRNTGGGKGLYRQLLREQQAKPRRPRIRQSLAVLLAALLLSGIALPAMALPANTPKEEVVYVNLNRDGSVDAIYVVNIFELNGAGQIVDYGNYSALRNLTSAHKIQVENEAIAMTPPPGGRTTKERWPPM